MNSALGMSFPGSRVLAGWSKHLPAWRPSAIWVGNVVCHQVEAAVIVGSAHALDPLSRMVLAMLADAPSKSDLLTRRLHVPEKLVAAALRSLRHESLTREQDGEIVPTDLGRVALASGVYTSRQGDRRTFYFIETEHSADRPRYLKLSKPLRGLPWPEARFHSSTIEDCIARSDAWKTSSGFPRDVVGLASLDGQAQAEAWSSVCIDRPLCCPLLFIQVDEPPSLLAFAVQTDGWVLHAREPELRLALGWEDVFPDLASPPSAESWSIAWKSWCQSRAVPPADADACRIEVSGTRATVHAPSGVAQRLAQSRSDLGKGEAWLVAGLGRIRAVAQLSLESM